ncbi:MAG: hypothetical protein WA210_16125, partial [Burkholderiaceae bacterium]
GGLGAQAATPTGERSGASKRALVLAAIVATVVLAAGLGWKFGASRPLPTAGATPVAAPPRSTAPVKPTPSATQSNPRPTQASP